ncbi:MAG TPA: hypothetical protein VFA02_14875 [Pseudacidobacterium sp.]|nr:hypothetical protein [Pseudacidobacterium sp.]
MALGATGLGISFRGKTALLRFALRGLDVPDDGAYFSYMTPAVLALSFAGLQMAQIFDGQVRGASPESARHARHDKS